MKKTLIFFGSIVLTVLWFAATSSFAEGSAGSQRAGDQEWVRDTFQKGKSLYYDGNYEGASAEWAKLEPYLDASENLNTRRMIDFLKKRIPSQKAVTVEPAETAAPSAPVAPPTPPVPAAPEPQQAPIVILPPEVPSEEPAQESRQELSPEPAPMGEPADVAEKREDPEPPVAPAEDVDVKQNQAPEWSQRREVLRTQVEKAKFLVEDGQTKEALNVLDGISEELQSDKGSN